MQSAVYFLKSSACEISYLLCYLGMQLCILHGLLCVCECLQVCGLCPVSLLKGSMRRTPLWYGWKIQIQICLPFASATVVYLHNTKLLFICVYSTAFPSWRFKGVAVRSADTSPLLHTTLGTSDIHLEYHHHILSHFFFNRNKGFDGVTKIWISNSSCQLHCCFRSQLETASVRNEKGPNGNQTGNRAWNIENANM